MVFCCFLRYWFNHLLRCSYNYRQDQAAVCQKCMRGAGLIVYASRSPQSAHRRSVSSGAACGNRETHNEQERREWTILIDTRALRPYPVRVPFYSDSWRAVSCQIIHTVLWGTPFLADASIVRALPILSQALPRHMLIIIISLAAYSGISSVFLCGQRFGCTPCVSAAAPPVDSQRFSRQGGSVFDSGVREIRLAGRSCAGHTIGPSSG